MTRRLATLLVLPFTGCFVDPGRHGSDGASASGPGSSGADDTSGPVVTSTGELETSTGITPISTSGVDPTSSTSDPSASDPSASDPSASDPTMTATTLPPAHCGDGVVDPGEGCDDGNNVDTDACLATCQPASCSDGVRSQSESDIDCGGPCSACGACSLCASDGDCELGLVCDGVRCVAAAKLSVDWLKHCGVDSSDWYVAAALPAGPYRVTALGGGGTNFVQGSNYAWRVACEGIDLSALDSGVGYASPDEAFAALPIKQIVRDYAGGPLRCGVFDDPCDDNAGSVEFSVALDCP